MSEESELAQLRRKLQEAEQRVKEADERAEEERKGREEAEQRAREADERAENERKGREEAEQRAREADERAEKERIEKEKERKKREEAEQRAEEEAMPLAEDFFDVGTKVAGVVFTTTQKVLGVESLSVHARAYSVIISCSEKACSFRYRGQGKDLVWRQIDVYGLPRHCSDYSLAALQGFVTREIKAYMRLRPVWGELVPEFVYFGNDFAMLWAFVNTYEGVSLRSIAQKNGGLPQSVKTQARTALTRLHSLGVVHGDSAPRHALQRERDGRIIWIDFEFSTLLTDTNKAEFTRLAEKELQEFESDLVAIPTLPEPNAIPDADDPTTTKRTKAC